jgi:hypothetical protein
MGAPVWYLDTAGVLKYAPGKGLCGVCIPGKAIFAAQLFLQALSQYQTQRVTLGLERLHGKLQRLRDGGGEVCDGW